MGTTHEFPRHCICVSTVQLDGIDEFFNMSTWNNTEIELCPTTRQNISKQCNSRGPKRIIVRDFPAYLSSISPLSRVGFRNVEWEANATLPGVTEFECEFCNTANCECSIDLEVATRKQCSYNYEQTP